MNPMWVSLLIPFHTQKKLIWGGEGGGVGRVWFAFEPGDLRREVTPVF